MSFGIRIQNFEESKKEGLSIVVGLSSFLNSQIVDERFLKLYLEQKTLKLDSIGSILAQSFSNDCSNQNIERFLAKLKKTIGKDAFLEFLNTNHWNFLTNAVANGAVENLKLLEKLNVNLDCIIDALTLNTTTHLAILYGQIDVVRFFLDRKTLSLNSKNYDGHTPLVKAASHGRQDMVTLIQKKMKPLSTQDKALLDKLLKTTPIPTKQLESSVLVSHKTPNKAIILVSTAILGNANEAASLLIEAAKLFQDFLLHSKSGKEKFKLETELEATKTKMRSAMAVDLAKFTDLTTDAKKIKQRIDALKDVSIEEGLSLEYLTNILTILLDPMEELLSFVEAEHIARGEYDTLVNMYNIQYCKFREKGIYRGDLLNKAFDIITAHESKIESKNIGSLYYNLAQSEQFKDSTKYVEYLKKAQKYLPNDLDISFQLCRFSKDNNDEAALNLELDKIEDPNLKSLITLHSHINRNPEVFQELLPTSNIQNSLTQNADSESIKSAIYDIKIYQNTLDRNESNIITLCVDQIQDTPLLAQRFLAIALGQLLFIKNYQASLELIQTTYKAHGQLLGAGVFDVTLLYYEFFAYEKNNLTDQATERLEKLNALYERGTGSNNLISRLVHNANYQRFLNLVNEANYEVATKYLEYLDLEDRDTFNVLIQSLVQYERKQKSIKRDSVSEEAAPQKQEDVQADSSDKSSKNTAPDAAFEEAQHHAAASHILPRLPSSIINFVTMVDTGQLDKNLLPAQLAESYFRYKKYDQKFTNSDVLLYGKVEWTIGHDKYSHSKNCNSGVYKLESISHYYTGIEKHLLNQLDPTLKEEFSTALEHVRIARNHNQSGVKIYDNIIELKIMGHNGNQRLFTDTLYKVGNNLLALFNKIGTHADVAHLHKANGELRIIETSSEAKKESSDTSADKSYIADPQEYYSQFVSNLDYTELDPAIFLSGEGGTT